MSRSSTSRSTNSAPSPNLNKIGNYDRASYLDKVKGTRFEGIENPWLNNSYHKSWLDNIGQALGMRTAYDRWLEEQEIGAKAWDTANLTALSEEEYNSAEEQAKRLREAGLNPDLTGGVESGQATESQEFDPATAMAQVPEGTDPQQFLSGLGRVFTGAIGIGNTILGAVSAFQNILGQHLKYTGDISSTAFDLIGQFAGTDQSPEDVVKSIKDSEVFKSFNSHTRRRLSRVLDNAYDNNGWKLGSASKYFESRGEAFGNAFSSGQNEGNFRGYGSSLLESYKGIVESMSKLYPKLLSASMQRQIAQDEYDSAVMHLKDAGLEAGAFNEQNSFSAVKARTDKGLEHWREQAQHAVYNMQNATSQMEEIKAYAYQLIYQDLRDRAFNKDGSVKDTVALFTLGSLMGLDNVSAGVYAGLNSVEGDINISDLFNPTSKISPLGGTLEVYKSLINKAKNRKKEKIFKPSHRSGSR